MTLVVYKIDDTNNYSCLEIAVIIIETSSIVIQFPRHHYSRLKMTNEFKLICLNELQSINTNWNIYRWP